ncbi:unnamed protein product [Orchesella dallaii]|uniref:Uncharacterized protein n=1 Tax=Orchesella dallaii TaxID=48710 RepID=A0ABP1R2X8_9HEXA
MTIIKLFRQNLVIWMCFQVTFVYAGVLPSSKNNTRITDFEINPGSNGIPIIVPGGLDIEIDIPGAGGGATTFNPVTTFPILSTSTSSSGGTIGKYAWQ